MSVGILFDLDGTLLDTLEDLTDCTNYALRQFGYPQRSMEYVRRIVGNGALRQISLAVPDGEDPEPVLDVYLKYYAGHCRNKTAPYAGIPGAVSDLSAHYPTAIVSNKPDSAVKILCAEFFPGIPALGVTDICPRKPAPDMVYQALEAIGAEHGIYVGDSEVDLLTAANAKMPCISVLWGFRNADMLLDAGAGYLCGSPDRLTALIEQIRKEYKWQMNSTL